jgi:hypothetical protein
LNFILHHNRLKTDITPEAIKTTRRNIAIAISLGDGFLDKISTYQQHQQLKQE